MNYLYENTCKALEFYEKGLLSESELLNLIESGVIDAELLDEGFMDSLKNGAKKAAHIAKRTLQVGALAGTIGGAAFTGGALYKGSNLHDNLNNAKSNYTKIINDKSESLKTAPNKEALMKHIDGEINFHNKKINAENEKMKSSYEYTNNPDNRARYEKIENGGKLIDKIEDEKKANVKRGKELEAQHFEKAANDAGGGAKGAWENTKTLFNIGSNAYKKAIDSKHATDPSYERKGQDLNDTAKKIKSDSDYITRSNANLSMQQQAIRDDNAKYGGKEFHKTYTEHLGKQKLSNDIINTSKKNIDELQKHKDEIKDAEDNVKKAEDKYNNSIPGKFHKGYTKAKEIGHGLYKAIFGD